MMKNEGNEETSTFVIREGVSYAHAHTHTHTHRHAHTPTHTLTEDKDALIVACEDERYVVVAGTFEKLVELLACDEKPGKCSPLSCDQCYYY